MGLDSVEILVEVENAFDISIPDREAEIVYTVGDLHDLVWKYVENKINESCLSRSLFYRLRSSFVETFKINQEHFHPNVQLNKIIPQLNRRENWKILQQDLELEFPNLVLPEFWSYTLFTFSSLSIFGSAIVGIIYRGLIVEVTLFPIIGIVATIVLSYLLRFKRTEFNPATIRDFVRRVLALNYRNINKSV
ncbi:acyl carrier protein [Solitalea canadensis]|uniref:Acyl carrier protein n=1 Tax=Solitalea canadensis (strain ATCC 29591 / DSM 3403 / JCM 21819 / LMG 8368 / NBRC 15130 / NCIMB 12057 / USAM 9D) TaxID=929556 RepID=H8KS88_SOLCM|nr:hypothetical protein [Solitalea canadensis]AFD07876.1 hypothetical protein Solca_2851 [Solitalea canadensis DSM 3403]